MGESWQQRDPHPEPPPWKWDAEALGFGFVHRHHLGAEGDGLGRKVGEMKISGCYLEQQRASTDPRLPADPPPPPAAGGYPAGACGAKKDKKRWREGKKIKRCEMEKRGGRKRGKEAILKFSFSSFCYGNAQQA